MVNAGGEPGDPHSTFSIHHSTFERRAPFATLLVFTAALTLYVTTLAPGLLWGGGDFARFQTWAYLGRIEGKVDIFAHPLWVYVAHPFTWLPIHDPAWRANFAAAVLASSALVFVFLSANYLTRSGPAALLATGALAVSHTFWTYAVMPKVYSLNALLLAACIYFLLRWRASGSAFWLAVFAFLYGLSFLNHLVMATAAGGFAAFIAITLWRRRDTVGQLPLALAFFIAGLLPYVYLVVHSATAAATGGTIVRFMAGLAYAFTHPMLLLRGCGWGAGLALYQFPLTTVVGIIGFLHLRRRDPAMAAAVGFIVLGTVAFLFGALDPAAGSTYIWNLHYYLQAYVAFALGMAPGFEVLWTRWCCGRRGRQCAVVVATLVVPIVLYAAAPHIVRRVVHNVPDFRPLPGRDNLTYVLSPWKHNETGARAYGEGILRALPEGSVLFADYGPWAVLRYLQVVEHARPDVAVVHLETEGTQVPMILRYNAKPDLFLADTYRYYDLDGIRQHFDIIPAGPIFRLVPKAAPRSN